MHTNNIPPFDQLDTPSGVCTADGWGVKIHVHQAHLIVEDGVGRSRRTRRYHKATSGLHRLVIVGHSGYITFEASRWLADAKTQIIHLDSDGRILSVSAQSPNLPVLRRAQAKAITSPAGVEIIRYLLTLKVGGQRNLAARLRHEDGPEMVSAVDAIELAADLDTLRIAEARAAVAYWNAWSQVEIRFNRADQPKVPIHWLTFDRRRSTQSGSGRRAINPINAILNYLYALLEAEARIAAITVGLDPGLGILHLDKKSRDSFALDLMEAARPAVDTYVLDLVEGHVFRRADFNETRAGVCRIAPTLAHQLTNTTTIWHRHLAEPAEQVAHKLVDTARGRASKLTTPLTERNRRTAKGSGWSEPNQKPRIARNCRRCGKSVSDTGKLCGECRSAFQDESDWLTAGRRRLAKLREEGEDPAHGGEAGTRRAAKISVENRKSGQWNRDNQARPDPAVFAIEILPGLQGFTLKEIKAVTGLSLDYCSKIKRGLKVPHPRHWQLLRRLPDPDGIGGGN